MKNYVLQPEWHNPALVPELRSAITRQFNSDSVLHQPYDYYQTGRYMNSDFLRILFLAPYGRAGQMGLTLSQVINDLAAPEAARPLFTVRLVEQVNWTAARPQIEAWLTDVLPRAGFSGDLASSVATLKIAANWKRRKTTPMGFDLPPANASPGQYSMYNLLRRYAQNEWDYTPTEIAHVRNTFHLEVTNA